MNGTGPLGRRGLVASALAALALALGACTAPTLPLPPPSLPEVSAGSAPGRVRLASTRGVDPHALVVIYNRNPSVPLGQRVGGAEADADGSWSTEVVAKTGDVLDITQESGNTRSPPTTLRVP
jgi:hypothetical protein